VWACKVVTLLWGRVELPPFDSTPPPEDLALEVAHGGVVGGVAEVVGATRVAVESRAV
jgi:hypothetical protein